MALGCRSHQHGQPLGTRHFMIDAPESNYLSVSTHMKRAVREEDYTAVVGRSVTPRCLIRLSYNADASAMPRIVCTIDTYFNSYQRDGIKDFLDFSQFFLKKKKIQVLDSQLRMLDR